MTDAEVAETIEMLGVVVALLKKDKAKFVAVLRGANLKNSALNTMAREAFGLANKFVDDFDFMKGRWQRALAVAQKKLPT